jgi:hypothetical protein
MSLAATTLASAHHRTSWVRCASTASPACPPRPLGWGGAHRGPAGGRWWTSRLQNSAAGGSYICFGLFIAPLVPNLVFSPCLYANCFVFYTYAKTPLHLLLVNLIHLLIYLINPLTGLRTCGTWAWWTRWPSWSSSRYLSMLIKPLYLC